MHDMNKTNFISVCMFVGMISFIGRSQLEPTAQVSGRINGMCLVSVDHKLDSSHLIPIKSLGSNWVAIIPYAYMPSSSAPEIEYDAKWQWYGERIDGVRSQFKEIHKQGLSVMVKPQLWIGHGSYTGAVAMMNEEDWLSLEENYSEYILAFALLAEEEEVEMLSIGTELQVFVQNREVYWRELIKQVRSVYTGRLTYSANWDEYDNVKFWDLLDYIGVDAYFPISKERKRKLKHLKVGWEPHADLMDSIALKFNKQILFTEYGYRSVKECAMRPWDYDEDSRVDQNAQEIALEALYQTIWANENVVGGFLWKWYPDHANAGGKANNMFTVQNKRAENVVKKHYSK
jgi:hypothetical protein